MPIHDRLMVYIDLSNISLFEPRRGLLPVLEKFGVITAEQLDVDSLAARMRQEIIANGSMATSPSLIGAWARK